MSQTLTDLEASHIEAIARHTVPLEELYEQLRRAGRSEADAAMAVDVEMCYRAVRRRKRRRGEPGEPSPEEVEREYADLWS